MLFHTDVVACAQFPVCFPKYIIFQENMIQAEIDMVIGGPRIHLLKFTNNNTRYSGFCVENGGGVSERVDPIGPTPTHISTNSFVIITIDVTPTHIF